MREYTVKFQWDPDSAVWIATSDDVRGLVLESGSFDALVERVKAAVPELIALNCGKSDKPTACRISYFTEREDYISVYG